MGLHEDRMKAMLYQRPDNIPVGVGILPAAWIKYREELDGIVSRYPSIFGSPEENRDYDAVGGTYVTGEHIDAWGCVWSNIKQGMESIVTGHAVPTREAVHTLEAPEKETGFPHGFMFLRLTDLRGFSEFMMDLAEEPPELQMLIDIVLEHNLKQARLLVERVKEPGQLLYFGDDLGMQDSLPMSPDAWRTYMKPCFSRIYGIVRGAGHYVYMHTDGHIHEIIPDLVDCGVNVVNPQFRANGLDNLVRVCKGKVCVDLDLDRQLFPFCSRADIFDHVEESVRKLGAPEGGLWLKAEVGEDVPIENIEAICAALDKYRRYYS